MTEHLDKAVASVETADKRLQNQDVRGALRATLDAVNHLAAATLLWERRMNGHPET